MTCFYSKTATVDLSVNFWIQVALIIQSLIVLYVWYLGGFRSDVFTYLIIGRVYKALSDSYFFETFGRQIIVGEITSDLMYPQNYLRLTLFKTIGYRLTDNIAGAVGMVFAGIIAVIMFADIELSNNLWIVCLFLPISFWIQHFMGFIFACTTFFLDDKRAFEKISRVYNIVFLVVLTGTILPLDKLPFTNISENTPFAFLLHHPMQIYLGNYTLAQTGWTLLGGITWCFALYFLARFVFKAGLKRNEAVGL